MEVHLEGLLVDILVICKYDLAVLVPLVKEAVLVEILEEANESAVVYSEWSVAVNLDFNWS